MVELDLGKVVMDSYNDLDNKPKINGVELKGELRTSEFGLDQAIEAVNLARLNFKELNTLEEFVNETAKENDVPHFSTMWDGGGWGPLKRATHYKYLIAYEGRYNNPGSDGVIRDDVKGSGLFWDNENNIWYVTIQGNVGTLTFSYFKIEPNQIPTNNLLATVAGTPLDAVQGKVLDDRITNTNISRKSGKQYNTLEEFVEDTASSINVSHMGRFKDTGNFVREYVDWYRYFISYQNVYVSGSANSIEGNGIFFNAHGKAFNVLIKGNKDSGVTLKYEKLITETELNNGLTSIKVYSNTDFQTVADSVPINKKLTCRMLGSGDSPVTGLPLNQLFIVEIYAISEVTVIATAYAAESGNMYVNRKASGNWKGWEKKTNTVS